MNKIKAIIIEDELRNQKYLQHLLETNCPEVQIVAFEESVKQALETFNQLRPDLIFLDIQLKDGTGFELLEQIHSDHLPKVIFTTAFDQYAIEAFKYNTINYLLKPIDQQDLICSVDKAKRIKLNDELSSISRLLDQVSKRTNLLIEIPSPSATEYIKISEIIHLTAMGSYCKITLKGGISHTVSKPIRSYVERLQKHDFFRVHQSHLINLNSVIKVNKGDHTVLLENGAEVAIARNRKDEFKKAMDRMLL